MLDAKTIIVVAADQGLRRSVAFALAVEGYSTESYDTVQKAEASGREALCTILDDDIPRSEPQAAAQLLRDPGRRAMMSMACRPFSNVWTTRH
nr:histidine kinase [Sinorhizobium meliloti]